MITNKDIYLAIVDYSFVIREIIENATDKDLSIEDCEQIDYDREDIYYILESEL